jgi:hypothetical protein|tara:strand:- start:3358 stop:3552 length:195 start_codon:yes stop_codon:yes gene_type:complete
LSISWRKFKVLLFSLVSQESAFYAPYHAEMYEEMKTRNEKESDFTKNKQKTKVSLDVAMNDLGV